MRMPSPLAFLITAGVLLTSTSPVSQAFQPGSDSESTRADIVVYGGTAAAVMAAVQAKSMDKSVVIVSPDRHLGGLSSGGLGWTDTGNKAVIGGLAKEFYHRVYKHYQNEESWTADQTRGQYGKRAEGDQYGDDDRRTMWVFEPHVAESLFDEFVSEYGIPVVRDAWLDRENGVEVRKGVIVSITTLDGRKFAGKMFVDATYEGDLVAAAGVDTTFGREGIEAFDEPHAGVQTGVLHHSHHFNVLSKKVDPYVVPGDPSSGVIPLVSADPPGEFGAADHRIQAYCFRTCMTNHAPNLFPWPKPEGYDAGQYEVLLRAFEAGWRNVTGKFDPIPNRKTDTNNHGPVSFDNIGFNYDYPEATYERRREIIQQHATYQKGMLYFMANDPRVPEEIRNELSQWGLAKDEFLDNGHWPHQLYIREARRMMGQFVMTENHLRKQIPTPESVGMGSYTIDSHNVQRYITPEGTVQNEGDIGVSTHGPYAIAMGALLPKSDQCQNLVVPVCVSSTHIAFGSIRMEPVFMILGQSAATIASLAIDADSAVQDVPYEQVKQRLLADQQILTTPPGVKTSSGGAHAIKLDTLQGVSVDDREATRTGNWTASHSSSSYFGYGYQHDGKDPKRRSTAEFIADLPTDGEYNVRIGYPPHGNRSRQTQVSIYHADGVTHTSIDQTKTGGQGEGGDRLLTSVGTYRFDKGKSAKVVISNQDANGYVVIDVVNWLPTE